jgi:hypothetical protein
MSVAGRLVTAWPAGDPVDQNDPARVPWAAAAELLAGLHLRPAPVGLPPLGAPSRIRRTLDELRTVQEPRFRSARHLVETAAQALPPLDADLSAGAGAGDGSLGHGDFHLGQLVQVGDRWRLIDVDDVGRGDARWDFAWPASWFAVGVLPGDAWATLIDSYRAAGGPALGPVGDPWPLLDLVARAATVHVAARSVFLAAAAHRELDDLDAAFLDACGRLSD